VSYLGAGETALHLTLYEQLKILLNGKETHAKRGTMMGEISNWLNVSGAAAASKVIAVLVSYPHEVRQPQDIGIANRAGDPDENKTGADG
jgi:solute carrier family 25 protein 33/36